VIIDLNKTKAIFLVIDLSFLQAAHLTEARKYYRKSLFHLDIIESENFMGFHVPEEALCILGGSINCTCMRQTTLSDAIPKK
jgi:formate-dependent nitrite reductase cytochrome c552 subunit